MSRLAELMHKYGFDEDATMEVLDHIKKAGSEVAGIESYVKGLHDNLNDMRFQLKAKGVNVDPITHGNSPPNP